nr:PfkB family carbohydrate kinase [Oceaniglobus trochenteri]
MCVGRLYCDLVFSDLPRMPTLGHEVYAGALALRAGGGAVITAAHLAQLGRPAHLAAFWPGPPFQDQVMGDVAAVGVGHDLCLPAAPGDPQITVAMSGAQDRAFLTRRVGRAVPDLATADLERLKVGHLHIGELATLAEAPGLIDIARAAGLSISLDCSWDDDTSADHLALIARVDVFFPNEEEVAQLARLGVNPPYAPLTVTKRGARGALGESESETAEAPGLSVPVVDTTGAGDAFNSGFLDGWLAGAPLAACLAAGNARGAVAVQQRGGFTTEGAAATT